MSIRQETINMYVKNIDNDIERQDSLIEIYKRSKKPFDSNKAKEQAIKKQVLIEIKNKLLEL